MNKRIALGALTALGLIVGSAANAAEGEQVGGWYLGASIGQAKISLDDTPFSETDTGYKVFGGYSFNPYFGIELHYIDSGNPTLSATGGSIEIMASGIAGFAVGRIPVNESFAFFGKLGVVDYDSEATFRFGNQTLSDTISITEVAYGIGFAAALRQNFELRVEYETVAFDDGDDDSADFSFISIGGAFKF